MHQLIPHNPFEVAPHPQDINDFVNSISLTANIKGVSDRVEYGVSDSSMRLGPLGFEPRIASAPGWSLRPS